MCKELAVVMDVAGTILRMYRVAKDIEKGAILVNVVTWKLIMEKKGRVLVVPQVDPSLIFSCRPDDTLGTLIDGREQLLEISCASSPISKAEAVRILGGSQAKIRDLQEVQRAVLNRCPGNYHTAGMIVDVDLQEVVYALSTGGSPFPGLKDVLLDLKNQGADVYVASGDSMRSLAYLKELGIDLSRVYPVSGPRRKKEIIVDLKNQYRQVVMVGDGLNDLYALRAADLGILTVQQDTRPTLKLRDAADKIITDIRELPKILVDIY
ncbi:MAG: HAD family hydrolase [Methanothrix sp.]|jgi:Cu+-exporting ATPase|nr:HAD family hydrolase [Methanothrix sp.]